MQTEIETWGVGGGEVQCYTEDFETHRKLTRLNPVFAVYTRSGRAFAWQHLVPRCVLAGLGCGVAQKRVLEPKELRPSASGNSTEQDDLFGDGLLVDSEEKPAQDEAA